jgi:hypothetical protein
MAWLKRHLLVAIGVVVLAAAILAAVAIVRRQPARNGARPVITLDVNDESALEVAPGTPLVFTVHLSGDRRGAVTVGTRATPWHSSLRLETEDARALPWPVEPHGTPIGTTLNDDARLTSTENSPVARLEWQRTYYKAQLAVSPEHTKNLSGAIRIRAVLDPAGWVFWRWRGRVESRPVTIRVHPEAAARSELQQRRLMHSAAYFLDRHLYEEAHAAANELVRLADGVDAQILRGDALAGLKRPAEALGAYRRALQLRPRSYEEPALLLERIARVSR